MQPVSGSDPTLTFTLPDEAATMRLARRLAGLARAGDVIALSGPLGAGKTVFARAFVRALCGEALDVPSPTYTLVQTYEAPSGAEVWHFDFYRIDHPDEAVEAGLEDALTHAISLIEWPERLGPRLPASRLDAMLTGTEDDNTRILRLIAAGPAWRDRLSQLGGDTP